MGILESKGGLQLLSVEMLLSRSLPLKAPLFISPIHSRSSLETLCQHLQSQGGGDRAVQLFSPLDPRAPVYTREGLAPLMTAIAAEPLEFPLALYVEAPAVQPALQRLVDVVAQLRHPEDGCPWDLEQTPESLTPYILEEAYETIDAIQSGDAAAIADELGDLLLQVVLQAQIASEAQQFTLKEVAQGIAEKLVRRHPHVFGDLQVNSIEQVKANWESIKAAEQGRSPAEVQHISHRMQKDAKRFPPIVAGLKLSKQAAEAGLEWSDLGGVWEKFYEELAEFQEALLNGPTEDQLAELGDLLFTLINVARWCQLDPSAALQKTNQKLIERIRIIEGKADRPLTDYSLQELDDLWNGAKQDLAHAPSQGANSQNGQHSLPSSAAEVSS